MSTESQLLSLTIWWNRFYCAKENKMSSLIQLFYPTSKKNKKRNPSPRKASYLLDATRILSFSLPTPLKTKNYNTYLAALPFPSRSELLNFFFFFF